MSKYVASDAPDWRSQIARNQARTRWVIGIFFFIYFCLGLLLDVVVYSSMYPYLTAQTIFLALLHLQLFPMVTCGMLLVAAISLWATYHFYDKIMLLGTEYQEVTPDTANSLAEKQLYNVVDELRIAAGLRYMPRVFLIEADYMNAFASGYSEKSAMVAITRGLLVKLDRSELQAVMAHELSHIRHMDIKLTLTAAVLTNIMLMVLDMVFYNMMYSRDSERDRRGQGIFIVIMILRFLMPVLTLLLMMYLSRTREYMADAGCVELMRDNTPLGRALIKINQDHQDNAAMYRQQYNGTAHEEVRRAAYIYDPIQAGIESPQTIAGWFSSHPALKDRLKALGFENK